MTWTGARCLGISTISDTVVPCLPGKAAAALWSLPAGHCCLGQASLGRLQAVCPWLRVLPLLEESSPSFSIPRSEQTLPFVPGQRIVCPDVRKALLRTLCARRQSGSS